MTSADIADATITAADVKNGSLLKEDFKSGQLLAGPAGPAGPPGPRGQKGAQGPPGISGLERKDVSSPSSGSDSKSVVAVCPSGKRVVGGGARVTGSGAAKVSILENFPDSDGDKWNAVAREVTATGPAWQLTSYALCATVAP